MTQSIKGILLAGGSGKRLYPLTMAISKQLLPVYDKPMVYFPLTTLMLAGVRDIAIITRPQDQTQFIRLLGDGSQWGVSLTYLVQDKPEGLAQAYLIAEDFLDGAASLMALGDNIFFGSGLTAKLRTAMQASEGATVFGYQVTEPERYGVLGFNENGGVNQIIEKPRNPPSNLAVTGLYVLDNTAPAKAAKIEKSDRGELEITSVLNLYLKEGKLSVDKMGRGYAWFDTGTHASLLEAGLFVKTVSERQSVQIGCPEEIAFKRGWISAEELMKTTQRLGKSHYGEYLRALGTLSGAL